MDPFVVGPLCHVMMYLKCLNFNIDESVHERYLSHKLKSLLLMPMMMYPAELEVSILVSPHLHPNFLYVSSSGSDESLHSRLTCITVLCP